MMRRSHKPRAWARAIALITALALSLVAATVSQQAGTVGASPGPPSKPILWSPENDFTLIDNTPHFEWVKGENADNHRFLIDNDSNFSTPNENRVFTSENNYTIANENALVNGIYYWKVIAKNAENENSSNTWIFKIDTTATGVQTCRATNITGNSAALNAKYYGTTANVNLKFKFKGEQECYTENENENWHLSDWLFTSPESPDITGNWENRTFRTRENFPENFGYENIGSTQLDVDTVIVGSKFSCPAGTANGITVYIKNQTQELAYIKCAIYDSSLNYVGGTEEAELATGTNWRSPLFPVDNKPTLTAGDYWLFVWGNAGYGETIAYYDNGSDNQGLSKSLAYGEWPATIESPTYTNRKFSIYCDFYVSIENVPTSTKVIAAYDSSAADNAIADYKCDGDKDWIEFENAENAIGVNGGKIKVCQGHYYFNHDSSSFCWYVKSEISIVGDNKDNTIIYFHDKDGLNFIKSGMKVATGEKNILIKNITVSGSLEEEVDIEQNGIWILGTNVVIDNCNVNSISGIGIYLETTTTSNSNLWVKNCVVNRTGDQGICDAKHGIQGNDYILNNTVIEGGISSVHYPYGGHGISIWAVENVVVANNKIENSGRAGIYVTSYFDWISKNDNVQGNEIKASGRFVLYPSIFIEAGGTLENTKNVNIRVRGNKIRDFYGISLNDKTENCLIENNSFYNTVIAFKDNYGAGHSTLNNQISHFFDNYYTNWENISSENYSKNVTNLKGANYYGFKVLSKKDSTENEGKWKFFTTTVSKPILISPPNGSFITDRTPLFEWSGNAASYKIQISIHENFDNVIEQTTVNLYYQRTENLLDNHYYWRVIAYSGELSETSDIFTFFYGLLQPVLFQPQNGITTQDNTPTFQWTCSNADNYRLLVDNDSDFTSPEENHLFGATDNTYTVVTPLADENYSWKVVALAAGMENSSAIWTFIIDTTPPSKPILVSPENNKFDNILTQTFTWTWPENGVAFHIQIDDENGFTSPLLENTTLVDNSYVFVFSSDGNYWWRVRARDSALNWSDWADNFKLTIENVSDTTAPISFVNPISPYWDNSTPRTVAATASDASGVARVALYYRFSTDNSSWGAWTWYENDNVSPWSWSFAFPSGNGHYQFYTTARDNSVNHNEEPPPGAKDAFCGLDNVPPSAPFLVWPANGENIGGNNTPNLDWNPVSENSTPVRYYLQVDDAGDFSSPNVDVNTTADNYKISLPQTSKRYYWHVMARDNAGNWGSWSGAYYFDVYFAPPPPEDTTPPVSSVNAISPYWGNASPRTVTATATDDMSGVARVALWYRFSADNSGWGSWTWYENDNASPWSWSFAFSGGNGYYEFYSTARDVAGNEEAAPAAKDAMCGFDNTPPSAPSLLEPSDGATLTNRRPTFRWSVVTDNGLVLYHIQVANNPGFAAPVIDFYWLIDNYYTPTSDLINDNYYWHVRAKDGPGNIGSWSGVWTFEIVAANQPPATSNLLTQGLTDPTHLTTLTPTFSWTYTDADGNPQTHYEIWVGTASGLDNMWNSGQVAGSVTSKVYGGAALSRGVTYYIQVRTRDGMDWGAWATGTFRINTPPTAPTGWTDLGLNLDTVTPTISWTKGMDAEDAVTTYVYVGTTSVPTAVETYTTGSSCQIGKTIFLSSNQLYYYRLRSWDGYEWSDYTTPADQFKVIVEPSLWDKLIRGDWWGAILGVFGNWILPALYLLAIGLAYVKSQDSVTTSLVMVAIAAPLAALLPMEVRYFFAVMAIIGTAGALYKVFRK